MDKYIIDNLKLLSVQINVHDDLMNSIFMVIFFEE